MNTPLEEHISTVEVVQAHYENAEAGRARNARIAFVAVVLALLMTMAFLICLFGWRSANRTLETRNRAVVVLTNQAIRRGKVDDCQDVALARVVDLAGHNQPIEGVLRAEYRKCDLRYPGP